MAYIDDSGISCGVIELSGLDNDPVRCLESLGDDLYLDNYHKGAFVVWSDIFGKNMPGNKLYHYVRKTFPKSNLSRTKEARNPNSGNKICVYVWKIPRNFKTWWKENAQERKPCSIWW